MAVRTYGPEILNGVHYVIRAYPRQQNEMMNVNETSRHLAISGKEIKPAH
jgi:hypothetical protein